MRRYLIVGLFIVFLVVAFSAFGQSLTPGNPCGASGIGKRVDGLIEPREGKPGMHVDPDGYWTTCRMPEPPKDCPGEQRWITWAEGENVCTTYSRWASDSDVILPALLDGESFTKTQVTGGMRGAVSLQCRNGVRVVIFERCSPAPPSIAPPLVRIDPPPPPKPVTCGPTVMMSGGSLVYRYDGPPVAPEQRRDFESPTGLKRSMVCGPSGRWVH